MAETDLQLLSRLADKYRQKASSKPREKWPELLKAHTLCNACGVRDPTVERWNRAAYETQQLYWRKNVETTYEQQREINQSLKKKLETIRSEYRKSLDQVSELFASWDCAVENLESEQNKLVNKQFIDAMKKVSEDCNTAMKSFANDVIERSVKLIKQKTPCRFAAVAMGSLARGESTPYSDLEFIFLVQEKTRDNMRYFHLLAMTIYFLIGNLQETKLKYMDIQELKGFDDKEQNGYKIDGLQPKAGNIPTGNGRPEQMNKFILTVKELIKKYRTIWNNRDPKESLKGDFTAMLGHTAVIYGDGELLNKFEAAKLNMSANKARQEAHHAMIKQDINDYDFLPLEQLRNEFYKSNLKSAIYRYPSILIYNLKLAYIIKSGDSWETLRKLRDLEVVSRSIDKCLQMLLASAQFIRLAAYLHHDSQNENITFLQISDSAFKEERERSDLWHIPHPLLYHMSLHMIPVKQLIIQNIKRPLHDVFKDEVLLDKEFTAAKLNVMMEKHSEAIRIIEHLWLPLHTDINKENLCKHLECRHMLIECCIYQREIPKAKMILQELNGLIPAENNYINKLEVLNMYLMGSLALHYEEMAPDDPHLPRYDKDVQHPKLEDTSPYKASYHVDQAGCYSNINDLERSEESFTKALNAWKASGPHTPQADIDFRAKFFYHRSNLSKQKRDYSSALREAEKSLELYQEIYGSDSQQHKLGYCHNSLANAHSGLKNYKIAEKYYKTAIGTLEAMGHTNGMLHFNLAQTQINLNEKNDAEASFRRAQYLLSKQQNINHSDLGDIKKEIGIILKSRNEYEEAYSYFQAGLDMYDIADHLCYAGKCYNEVAEYWCMKANTRSSNDMTTSFILHKICQRTAMTYNFNIMKNLSLVCKELCTRVFKGVVGSLTEDQIDIWRIILVALTLRSIKRWAARNLRIIQTINPYDPMPVYEFETGEGTRFYL